MITAEVVFAELSHGVAQRFQKIGGGWISGRQDKVSAWRVRFGAASASGLLASNAD